MVPAHFTRHKTSPPPTPAAASPRISPACAERRQTALSRRDGAAPSPAQEAVVAAKRQDSAYAVAMWLCDLAVP